MRIAVVIYLVSLMSMSGFVSVGFGADEYVVTNPNAEAYLKAHPMETKPRDLNVIEQEKAVLVEAAQAIVAYAKANGAEQTAAEVSKGKNGVFAKYDIGPQFRMIVAQFSDQGPNAETGTFFTFKGHNLFLSMLGVTFSLDIFADLSGWKFGLEYHKAAFSPSGKGWVKDIFWADEFWAANKIVRYIAYNQEIDRTDGLSVITCTAIDE